MGAEVTTLLLDTHVLLWLGAEPERLSSLAADAIDRADELAVASITWFELAWLAEHDRVITGIPVRTWLSGLASDVRSIPITPAIADTAVSLGSSFPADPADRIIYATAVEHGLRIVTKDQRLRRHTHPRDITIW
jgi:PIN domain nuclease of toxin-antitoxin system